MLGRDTSLLEAPPPAPQAISSSFLGKALASSHPVLIKTEHTGSLSQRRGWGEPWAADRLHHLEQLRLSLRQGSSAITTLKIACLAWHCH